MHSVYYHRRGEAFAKILHVHRAWSSNLQIFRKGVNFLHRCLFSSPNASSISLSRCDRKKTVYGGVCVCVWVQRAKSACLYEFPRLIKWNENTARLFTVKYDLNFRFGSACSCIMLRSLKNAYNVVVVFSLLNSRFRAGITSFELYNTLTLQ